MDNDLGLGDDVDAIALEVFNELNRLSEAEKKQDSKTEQGDWNKGIYILNVQRINL